MHDIKRFLNILITNYNKQTMLFDIYVLLEATQTGNIRFDIKDQNNIKNKKYHTVGKGPKYNYKIVGKG